MLSYKVRNNSSFINSCSILANDLEWLGLLLLERGVCSLEGDSDNTETKLSS
jgi:hypothetical protein